MPEVWSDSIKLKPGEHLCPKCGEDLISKLPVNRESPPNGSTACGVYVCRCASLLIFDPNYTNIRIATPEEAYALMSFNPALEKLIVKELAEKTLAISRKILQAHLN